MTFQYEDRFIAIPLNNYNLDGEYQVWDRYSIEDAPVATCPNQFTAQNIADLLNRQERSNQ